MAETKEYPVDPQTQKMIEDNFTYHTPRADQVPRYNDLRGKAKELAEMYARMVPPGRERATALTLLQNSIMMANAGIACGEK